MRKPSWGVSLERRCGVFRREQVVCEHDVSERNAVRIGSLRSDHRRLLHSHESMSHEPGSLPSDDKSDMF
jgi:hypothetical protein